MSFQARVLADSISPQGVRLVTVEKTYPRCIHAEEMTHRVFGRNSASTRAIPLKKQITNLLDNPFIPEKFGINEPGMQAWQHLVGLKHEEAVRIWLQGRDRALTTAIELLVGLKLAGEILRYDSFGDREYVRGDIISERLPEILAHVPSAENHIDLSETSGLNVHKQLAGRGLEPYAWHTIIVTATEWDNYFALRDHKDAQGEIATIARLTKQAFEESTPRKLKEGEWHLPLVNDGEFDNPLDGIKASAARCAATSYNRQMAKRKFEDEMARYSDLVKGGHMSPLEHQATPFSDAEVALRNMVGVNAIEGEGNRMHDISPLKISQICEQLQFNGNLRGWNQHRKDIQHESNFAMIA